MFTIFLIYLILAGKKTMTSRDTLLCRVGEDTNLMANRDYSKITGKRIKMTNVYKKALSQYTDTDAAKEGFKNLMVFKQYWKKYIGEWIPDRVVWVHEFKMVKG